MPCQEKFTMFDYKEASKRKEGKTSTNGSRWVGQEQTVKVRT